MAGPGRVADRICFLTESIIINPKSLRERMGSDDGERPAEAGSFFSRSYDGVRRIVDRASYASNFVLSIMMLVSGMVYIFEVYEGNQTFRPTTILGFVVMMICAIAIISDKNRNLPKSVGLFAIGMGSYRALSVVYHLEPHSQLNLLWYVFIALGLNLVISGRAYLKGSSRARPTIMIGAATMVLVNVILIYAFKNMGMSMKAIFDSYPMLFLQTMMYIVFLIILDTEELRSKDWLEVHNRLMSSIRRTYLIDNTASISTEGAEGICSGFSDRHGWITLNDGGPAESEFRTEISNGDSESFILAQKWKGSDDVFITMSDHQSGTLIQASRLTAVDAESDGSELLIFSANGEVLRFRIEKEEER